MSFQRILIKFKANQNYLILIAFFISALYLVYLALTSQVLLIHDAIGYEWFGKCMRGGLFKYLSMGEQREPIYPFFVALSMSIGDKLSISYLEVVKFVQVIILFSSQLLACFILKRLKVNSIIIATSVLYIGISPAIVNSSLRLFSEIASYPFVLLLIIISASAWKYILSQNKSYLKTILFASLFSAIVLCNTFVKGLFQFVGMFFLLPYMVFLIKSLLSKNKDNFIHSVFFIFISLFLIVGTINLYKFANLKLNGNYIMTDRRAWALYGNTARRVEKMSFENFLTAIAYVPGSGVCNYIFGDKKCEFWSYIRSDNWGVLKRTELGKLPVEEAEKQMIKQSAGKVFENPFQYSFFYFLEGLKMFFWEDTMSGLVAYPDWLEKIFKILPLNVAVCTMVSSLSGISFLFLIIFLLKSRRKVFVYCEANDNSFSYLLSIFILIISFTLINSFFFCVPRYFYPISCVFVILIGWLFNLILNKIKKISSL